ncbi:MAG: hypothetical protein ACE366_23330 [Bradymonadia bacterium]
MTGSSKTVVNLWWLAPAAVIVVALLTMWQRSQVPERSDWQDAAAHIKANVQPSDGVTWVPYHAGEGRLFFHDLPAFHLPEPEQADLSRYRRVWLLGAFGADSDDLEHRKLSEEDETPVSGHTVVEQLNFGPLSLELLEIKGPAVTFDMRKQLEQTTVNRGKKSCDFWSGTGWHCDLRKSPEQTRQCLGKPIAERARMKGRRRQHHHLVDFTLRDCGLDPWLHVSRDAHVIGDWPRRCVWMHPARKMPVRVTWPEGVGERGGTVVVDYGFVDKIIADNYSRDITKAPPKSEPDAPRTLRAQPLLLRVLRRSSTLSKRTVSNEKGWRRLTVPVKPGKGPIALEVQSEDHHNAYFCVDATFRESAE